MGDILIPAREVPTNLTFGGLVHGYEPPVYPKWLYREGDDPRMVEDSEEEAQAKLEGWDAVSAGAMANQNLTNWFWDLEDMSSKQLCVFAQDEFGVDLPEEADQEILFSAVTDLAKNAPQNRNRLVLMAHTIRMEYDETLEEIKRLAAGDGQGIETETISFEVYA